MYYCIIIVLSLMHNIYVRYPWYTFFWCGIHELSISTGIHDTQQLWPDLVCDFCIHFCLWFLYFMAGSYPIKFIPISFSNYYRNGNIINLVTVTFRTLWPRPAFILIRYLAELQAEFNNKSVKSCARYNVVTHKHTHTNQIIYREMDIAYVIYIISWP